MKSQLLLPMYDMIRCHALSSAGATIPPKVTISDSGILGTVAGSVTSEDCRTWSF